MSEPDKAARGITAFIIDTDKAGFGRGKTEPKWASAPRPPAIEFNDYVAQAEDVLGQEGEGFKIAMSVLMPVASASLRRPSASPEPPMKRRLNTSRSARHSVRPSVPSR